MTKTTEIVNANNKAIQQKIISEIKELTIINKHFEDFFRLVHHDVFKEPIVELSKKQKEKINILIN
jgi:hypothetical protein